MKYFINYSWAIIWGVITLILLFLPSKDLPNVDELNLFAGYDKIIHLGIFYVLTILLYWQSARKYQWRNNKWLTIIKTVLATIIFAGFTELGQMFISTRSADIFDLYADILGIAIASFSYFLLHPKFIYRK